MVLDRERHIYTKESRSQFYPFTEIRDQVISAQYLLVHDETDQHVVKPVVTIWASIVACILFGVELIVPGSTGVSSNHLSP